jgi:S1-C subfamily serine protease
MTWRKAGWPALAALVVLVALIAPPSRGAQDELSELGQVMSRAVDKISPAVVRVIVPEVAKGKETTRAPQLVPAKPAEPAGKTPVAPQDQPPEKPRDDSPAAPNDEPRGKSGEPAAEKPVGPAPAKPPEAEPAEKAPPRPDAAEPTEKIPVKTHVRTGLLVSADGYVVTSLLGAGQASDGLEVELADGRRFPAKRLGEDVQRDLLLLKIDGKDFPAPELAKKSDLAIGQWVLAIGRALPGAQPTVSKGIISALGRLAGVALQTDANVSPMNYGGPLVDLRGRVVGVIAAVGRTGSSARAERLSDSGIGFAIAMDDVLAELPELKTGARLEVPFLGVAYDIVRLEPGARVLRVIAATAAAESGLKEGDVIVEFGGAKIETPFQLENQIGSHKVGEKVTFKVVRGEQTLSLSGTLKARPEYLRE